MLNGDVISMPDKWEYPWYAAWDLAFHTIALSLVDFDFAKEQLLLMLRSLYSHPNGQMPAYEWNFSDVNPPVHAWATLFLYKFEKNLGREDVKFLERSFQGLMLNFNWWVNRKDPQGKNVFAGGFLGLDNIGVFDRSAPLPTGGSLEQADGTAWMAFYCQNMLDMAVILADHDPAYEEIAFKFLENFIWISYAMDKVGEQRDDMWDEEDGFYYDVLRLPGGEAFRLKVRSMVGLLPLCASTVFEEDVADAPPEADGADRALQEAPPRGARPRGSDRRRASSATPGAGSSRPSPGRSSSASSATCSTRTSSSLPTASAPSRATTASTRSSSSVAGQEHRVEYLPGDSNTGMFGGNSNWRGPIWMPVNALIVRGLLNLYGFYGDDFKVECPTGSGNRMTLFEVAKEISRRLSSIFLRDASGRRPVYGGPAKFQDDPHWRDLVLFYEYFHGDNGAGIGASHQTGWTGLVARLLDLFGRVTAQDALETPKEKLEARVVRAAGGRRQSELERPGKGEPCRHLGIPRSSRSTRGSGSRSSRPRWGDRRRSTTSPTRSSTGWPRTGSTSSGSSASGRPARRPGASRGRSPSGSPSTAASSPTSARRTSAAPASRSGTTASTRTSAGTRRSPGSARA